MMKLCSPWIIYFLHSASVLSFYVAIVLTLSIISLTYYTYHWCCHVHKPWQRIGRCPLQPARKPYHQPHFFVHAGTPILDLTRVAENIIAHSSTPNSLIQVYFIAGLIDITEKSHITSMNISFQRTIRISPISCPVPHLPIIHGMKLSPPCTWIPRMNIDPTNIAIVISPSQSLWQHANKPNQSSHKNQ